MSDITLINDSEQSSLVTNGLAKNGELYLKKAGSTDAGSIVVYDSGAWKTFANEGGAYSNAYSVSLDGTNDYLSLASTINLPDGPRTISAWVNFSNVSGTFNTILGTALASGSYGDKLGLHWSPSNGYIYFYDSGSRTPRYKNYTGGITTNTWYHLMIVDNDSGASGNFRMYVNGTDLGIPAPSANTTAPTAIEFDFIGKGGSGSTNEFPGLIDEVAIWNSDQSANLSEIRDTSGANPVPGDLSLMSSQPLHWWRMGDNDSGSGSTVTDQGSSGVDATLVNGASFSTTVPS